MLKTRFLRNIDWVLLGVTVSLVTIGLLAIWSTSFKANDVVGLSDTTHQLMFAGVGLTGMLVMTKIDYRLWAKFSWWLYGATVALLVSVMLFARSVLGAQRWIDLGFFQLQPSELAKLAMIVVLAKFLAKNYDKLEKPRYLLISMLYMAAPVGLVFIQPDLGTTLVILFTWFGMVAVSRVRKRYLVGLATAVVVMTPFAVGHLRAYQKARLTAFLDPKADPLGIGHNVIQSIITVGSGQVFGRGLAAGTQSQLNFLPQLAQHTDFVYAVIGEKMGFVGSALVIVLFMLFIWRGIMIAYQAADRFGYFVATGVVSMVFFHAVVNIGMNIGVAPVTGIPLPFVSYGGTSLIVFLAAAGLLESVAVRRKKIEFE